LVLRLKVITSLLGSEYKNMKGGIGSVYVATPPRTSHILHEYYIRKGE